MNGKVVVHYHLKALFEVLRSTAENMGKLNSYK